MDRRRVMGLEEAKEEGRRERGDFTMVMIVVL